MRWFFFEALKEFYQEENKIGYIISPLHIFSFQFYQQLGCIYGTQSPKKPIWFITPKTVDFQIIFYCN
jgi:hypothetical protein